MPTTVDIFIPKKLAILTGAFIGFMILTPLLNAKVANIFGLTMLAGLVSSMLAHGTLNVINNAYGKAVAKKIVLAMIVARAAGWVATLAVVLLPTSRAPVGFESIALQGFRMFIASQMTTLIAVYAFEVPFFDWLRRKLNSGFFVRHNIAAAIGSVVAHTVYLTFAISFTDKPFFAILFGGVVFKLIFGAVLSPVFVPVARWAGRDSHA